jgi:molecular chaperone DnaJ
MPSDYYEVLGVSRDADETEIKKAFRGLARELHPDVNGHDPDAEAKFKAAAEAYEVLSDAERRRTYDAYGHEGLRSGGFDPRASSFGSLDDLFQSLFGGGGFGGAAGPAGGGDVAVAVEIELADVASGARREIRFDAVTVCEHCRGNGAEPGTPIHGCERCGGAGQLRQVSQTPFGQMVRAVSCDVCHGAGKVPETPCEVCAGSGRSRGERTTQVDVPAGIEDGQSLRIAGAGHAGEAGAQPGDLYVEVRVAEDERFQREGTDLLNVVSIPATEAMLGTTVAVPTLEGEQEIELTAGTQPGYEEVLRGAGLPRLGGRRRGNQRVIVNVVVPTNLSDEQREVAERLDESLEEENLVPPQGEGIFSRVRRAFG